MASLKARFIPRNPEKYAGDAAKIFARSGWEINVMKYLDSSPAVIKWGSEELAIPYLKPYIDLTTGQAKVKVANYYPDFVVVYRDKNNTIQKEILEVKPLKEASAAKAKSAYDKLSLVVNIAKWRAAEDFATRNGMKFRVLTENSIFKQAPKKPIKPKSIKSRGTKK